MSSRQRWFVVLAACGALSGCATMHRHPVLPLTVQLSAPRRFDVHVFVTPGAATTPCAVRVVEGTVEAVRDDTLWFRQARALARPGGAPDCIRGRAAYVDLGGQPEVRSQTSYARPGRTAALVFFMGTFIALGTIVAIIAGSA
jgi:hypothetical protein